MQITTPALFKSKKFGAALIAAIVSAVGAHFGWTLEQIAAASAPFYAFIGMQGLDDLGKSKAEIEAVFKPTVEGIDVINTINTPG